MRTLPTFIGLIVVVIVAGSVIFALDRRDGATPTPSVTATPMNTATPLTAPADAVSAEEVVLETELGNIRLTLFQQDAPNTVKNFVTLGKRGYYSTTGFHRVIRDFMIQGGDPKGNGTGGESIFGATFGDEFNSNKMLPGVIAMANRGPATNGSQFFIVTESAQSHLDGKHTVFGKVADEDSMKVVRDIAAQPSRTEPQYAGQGIPADAVQITGFEIVK
jgi:cyclophilin family peptidyl-prolyl cis-trans isomerase